jgi:uncharacterized protein
MIFDTQDSTALITGASSGLGAEFARQLAPSARTLVLVARRLEALEAVKTELLALNPDLDVRLVTADLGEETGRAALLAWLRDSELKPNLLINNAGLGDYGPLLGASEARLKMQLEVNVNAVVFLTHALLPMLRPEPSTRDSTRAAGAGILNVSSLASMLPMPDLAVYAASKAFVTSFSEGIAIELRPLGIQVTCVCPGPTPTQFSQTARRADGSDTNREGQNFLRIPASQVVAEALAALRKGQPCVFPGRGVAVAGPLFRLLPRFLLRWILRRRHARSTL